MSLIIEIPKVSPEGSTYEGEEPSEMLELGSDPTAHPDGPIRYAFTAEVVSDRLIVKGTIELPLRLTCGRCAEIFSTTLRDSSFLHAYEISEGVETVDVTPDIREDVLLDLPPFPVCSADCKGLCPRCGTNLNKGSCACRSTEVNDRWSALDGFTKK
jgi:uncharacterized protein